MKALSKIILITLASAGLSQAAVTISIKDFTALTGTNGVPVLDTSGNAILKLTAATTQYSLSIGTIPIGFNWTTATASTIITNFTQFGATSNTFASNGLFNASIAATLPGNDTSFTGQTIYTLVGNARTVAASTLFVVFSSGTLFPTVDGSGAGAATSATTLIANVVFGTVVTPVTQPTGATFTKGVELAASAIPEPSAALLGALGALGLLRRRRI